MTDFAPPYRGELTVMQIAAGMNAATSNAVRLIEDADLLLANSRWPSAVSMAALAVEESGKVVILRRFLTAQKEEIKGLWRDYRTHTRKNQNWVLPGLVSGGARKIEDFRIIADRESDHPLLLDTMKQLGFYSDCLGNAHWSIPSEVIDQKLASELVKVAKILAPQRNISILELELWAKHVRPVWSGSVTQIKAAVANWYGDMQLFGLAPVGENLMHAFLNDGLTSNQAARLSKKDLPPSGADA